MLTADQIHDTIRQAAEDAEFRDLHIVAALTGLQDDREIDERMRVLHRTIADVNEGL